MKPSHPEVPERPSIRDQGDTDTLPMAPALGSALDARIMARQPTLVTRRTIYISVLAVVLDAISSWIAQLLINLITDVCYYGAVAAQLSRSFVLPPAHNNLRALVIARPTCGGLIAGVTRRWGSRTRQGHGIPEAMATILTKNRSSISIHKLFGCHRPYRPVGYRRSLFRRHLSNQLQATEGKAQIKPARSAQLNHAALSGGRAIVALPETWPQKWCGGKKYNILKESKTTPVTVGTAATPNRSGEVHTIPP